MPIPGTKKVTVSRQAVQYRLDDVFQSHDQRRLGRWVAIVDNGILRSLDIFKEVEAIEAVKGLYKNWSKINEVPCHLVRAALFGSRSPAAIAKLQVMYPECFQKTAPVPITWKQLHAKQVEMLMKQGSTDVEYTKAVAQWCLLPALEFFNIPTVLFWKWDEHRCYPPEELWGQLIGKEIKQPVYLDYNGIRCIPVHIPFPCGTPNSSHGYKGHKKIFDKSDVAQMGWFALVAADMIIFD